MPLPDTYPVEYSTRQPDGARIYGSTSTAALAMWLGLVFLGCFFLALLVAIVPQIVH